MIIKSETYPSLLVHLRGGAVRFRDGVAEVTDPAVIERLRKFARVGVVVPEVRDVETPETPPADNETAPPADNEHVASGAELFEPKGNASIDEWRAYAIQKGIEPEALEDLKREEIKQLLAE